MTKKKKSFENLNFNSPGYVILKDIFESKGNTEPELDIVYRLRSYFSKIVGKLKEESWEEGIEIDLDRYIERTYNNNIRDIFLEQDISSGLNIIALLDVSFTMKRENRIFLARKALLTLCKSLENLEGVNFSVYGYSGSKKNVFVTPVVKLEPERLRSVYPSPKFPFTHTNRAIEFATIELEKKIGKKLIILITDGYPEGKHKNEYYELSLLTKNAILKARKRG